jgi:transposase-like protein
MKYSIRYSETFKLKVVKELASGKFTSITEASRAYDIAGNDTVRSWVKKYGRTDLLPKVLIVKTPEEQSENERLKKRIKELEKALTDVTVSDVMHRAYFDIVCEQAGITDIDSMKKKVAKKLSKDP